MKRKKMNNKLVSIVILNYNGILYIDKCVEHAYKQDYNNCEIIFVDNNSTDGSKEMIERKYGENLKYIFNTNNLGFAGGMNSGINASIGDYVLLLNSDLFLEESYISNAVMQLESNMKKRIGMLAGIIYKYTNETFTNEIDALGLKLLPYHAVIDINNKELEQFVFAPSGAAMFLKREMLDETKLDNGDYLDSTYFAYGEDIEFFLRAQLFGWECLYVPYVIGWHIRSASFGGKEKYDSKPREILVKILRNRYYTVFTNYPISLFIWVLPWIIITEIGVLIKYILKGLLSIHILFEAYYSVLKKLPRLFRKRKWIMNRRKVSFTYLRSLFIKIQPISILLSLIKKL